MVRADASFCAESLRAPRAGDDGSLPLLSPRMREFAAVAAASPHPVLLQGETGSGKTHLARLIHELSPRRRRPFIPVNCGAIPHDLFEREMFGHVRGAFTGATESSPGLFEAASRGTLFLDELGELPLEVQPKLLRVLEEGAVRRLGAVTFTPVDVRIITASNRDLRAQVERKRFRDDLFYRCCVLEFEVRPLRERRREIPVLVRHLLRKNALPGTLPLEVTDAAMERIRGYDWPGNIRELGNALCQAAVFTHDGPIDVQHLPERVRTGSARAAGGPDSAGAEARRRYAPPGDGTSEREVIAEALHRVGQNRSRAAKALGMARSTLWAKIKQYGLE